MRKTIKKANSKWILLFLFTLFSVGVQGQWDEYGSSDCIKIYTGNVGGIEWETDPNDPNYIIPVFVLIPQYDYICPDDWNPYAGGGAYGPLNPDNNPAPASGITGSGGSGGTASGASSPPPPPEECKILVCSSLLIDKP